MNNFNKIMLALIMMAISNVAFAEKSIMDMSPSELRALITSKAVENGQDPSTIRFSSEPVEISYEVIVEKFGGNQQRVTDIRVIDSSEESFTMPNRTRMVDMGDSNIVSNNVMQNSQSFNGNGGNSHVYSPPMEGLVNFAQNTPWVSLSGEQEVVERENNETVGWFLFRQFRSHVERSSK